MKNSIVNFTALCGVVLKKKKKSFLLTYNTGTIRVYADQEIINSIGEGYTVTVSGRLVKKDLRPMFLECNQCTIFDKKPHFIGERRW